MQYLFLTGATGLVGRYLLRDLLAAGVPVAALGRPGKGPAAIESIMRMWEAEAGRALPRPVVIDGDLCLPEVVPDSDQRQWVAKHCDRMLHCAASMTFREDKNGEPFRTNNGGMEGILEFCRVSGIRKFHHVSTAYICGLRTGWILEREIDLGQENGNVYEVSKLTAEKMLRAADFLDERTIYRPASVVGDSRTGYTTSSHGFYLPLQLAYLVADKIPTHLLGERFFRLLGLRGDEGKNLVPVDWLSAAIVHLATHPEHHGETYHMTNPVPVTVKLIQEVVQEAIETHSSRRFTGTLSEEQIEAYEELFRQYMEIYRSHWRDDPLFDRTNTDRALPHLPCPVIDRDMLLRIASYPVKEKFILKRIEQQQPGFEPHEHLRRVAAARQLSASESAASRSIGLEVSGRHGGQWRLTICGGRLVEVERGLGPEDSLRYYLNSHTFSSLVEGRCSVEQSIESGRVLVEGQLDGHDRHPDLVSVLESIVTPA